MLTPIPPEELQDLRGLCEEIGTILDGRFFVLIVAPGENERQLIVTGVAPKDVAKMLVKEAFVASTLVS